MNAKRITRAVAVLLFVSAGVAGAQTSPVTGAWARVSLRDSAGMTLQPPTPAAFVIFSANGYFSQSAIPTGRPKIDKALADMTKDELVARFQGLSAWRGTYSITGDRLTRTTVADADPNDEGSALIQVFRFAGDTLILSSPNSASKAEARFVRAH